MEEEAKSCCDIMLRFAQHQSMPGSLTLLLLLSDLYFGLSTLLDIAGGASHHVASIAEARMVQGL